MSQESQLYQKSEEYKLFRKQKWFGAVHPNVQINAKLDYMISRVLLEMDQTSLNVYKKLCDLDVRHSPGLLKHHVNPKILINKSYLTQTTMTHIA